MKKSYKEVIYKCDHCDFESNDPKVTGIHEFNCEHRPETLEEKIERTRRRAKNVIYDSNNIAEVNDNIRNYLKEFFPDKLNQFSKVRTYANSYSNSYNYYLKSDSYQTDALLSKLKISIRISDYTNIQNKVFRLTDIKCGSKIQKYNEEFGDYREAELNKYKENDSEMIRLIQNIDTLKSSISKMQTDLYNSQDILKTKLNYKIEEIKNDYNFIDYNVEKKQIEIDLELL